MSEQLQPWEKSLLKSFDKAVSRIKKELFDEAQTAFKFRSVSGEISITVRKRTDKYDCLHTIKECFNNEKGNNYN